MSKKLFVGNLPFTVDEDQLRDMFSPFGQVKEIAVISDRETGRPRGFAFVTYENDQDAAKAIQELNGADCNGRPMKISSAEERQSPR